MSQLVIRRGIVKTAAEEDGPTFEQQFGILANAVIVEKYPQLDAMKIAFQLIEKNDDGSEAVGAMVYMVGKTVIFVPAFFKNNKLHTADMMFIAQTQQFLPLEDPWLAWLRDKDLSDAGEQVPQDFGQNAVGPQSALMRDYTDPITKTACAYLRGLLHTPVDLEKDFGGMSLLDTALHMGKEASLSLCSKLTDNANFLNATLTFYDGNALDKFAKCAYNLGDEVPEVELVMPFTKEAKSLLPNERKQLERDGYFIKRAAKDTPAVMKKSDVKSMFTTITEPGEYELLGLDGTLNKRSVVKVIPQRNYEVGRSYNQNLPAFNYMVGDTKFAAVVNGKLFELPRDVMARKQTDSKLSISSLGSSFSDADPGNYDDITCIFPNGEAVKISIWGLHKANDKCWVNKDGKTVNMSTNDAQTKPIITEQAVIVPKGTRVIVNSWGPRTSDEEKKEPKLGFAPVTASTLEAFITEYFKKNYSKAKVYTDGIEISISGDKTASLKTNGVGEAAYDLVKYYGVDADTARLMLKESGIGAHVDSPRSTTFFIEKKAAEDSDANWEKANIPWDIREQRPPQQDYRELPTFTESPEQLQKAVETAAQTGIKEVFDVTALKLLVKDTRFFDDIKDDIPLFMRTLDSLCRKLFQFYWHTDKMEEKYGVIKLKALEQSLKVTIDALSELTVFFKLRTVDGTDTTGDATGDLMTGQML